MYLQIPSIYILFDEYFIYLKCESTSTVKRKRKYDITILFRSYSIWRNVYTISLKATRT